MWPAELQTVPRNERLSFAVDQFMGSGHKDLSALPEGAIQALNLVV